MLHVYPIKSDLRKDLLKLDYTDIKTETPVNKVTFHLATSFLNQ